MKNKGIYLALLLVLALLMFSGCARYDRTHYPNPNKDNYVTDNGVKVNPNKGTQGADGLEGIVNDMKRNPNLGIPDNDIETKKERMDDNITR